MPRKRLTLEEKRDKMLEFLRTTKEVYLMKELEKLGSEKLGIVTQSVSDVVNSLVDDSLIESDKIGISRYFWCFPEKQYLRLKNKEAEFSAVVADKSKTAEGLQAEIDKEKGTKYLCDERTQLENEYNELKNINSQLRAEFDSFNAYSVESFNHLKNKSKLLENSMVTYKDNIYELLSFVKKRRPDLSTTELYKHFEIPDDFDD
eukprot:GAHX01001057.1.p1 GENE.GAHX01001057.1~~GAHX01001057.1.p1  ORF type:complete len:204 (-),score=39.76 GAHX01001057.1:51-662(-)